MGLNSGFIWIVLILCFSFNGRCFVDSLSNTNPNNSDHVGSGNENGDGSEKEMQADSSNPSRFTQVYRTLDSLKNVTEQLQKGFQELRTEQYQFEREVNGKFTELENQLNEMGGKVNITLLPTVDIHHRISQLQKKHEEELMKLGEKHEMLVNSVSSMHRNIDDLTSMHNMTERLKTTAELIVQERWTEVSIQWNFIEKHTLDYANDAISGYLETVVRFAYTPRNVTKLVPIFKFIHKLSFMDYKVYAYETFVHQLLEPANKDIFDGSEIFILAHHLRKNHGLNSKGYSKVPLLTKLVAGGSNVRLLYLQDGSAVGAGAGVGAGLGSEGEDNNSLVKVRGSRSRSTSRSSSRSGSRSGSDSESRAKRVKRAAKAPKGNGTRKIVPKRVRPIHSLDVHPKADMINRRQDNHLSYAFPIYGSRAGSFIPQRASFWNFKYNDNGFFTLENSITLGYLTAPGVSDNITTVGDPDPSKNNVEFKIIYIDGETLGIESASFPGRPLKAVVNEVGRNEINNPGPLVVFQVDGDPAQNYMDGTGGKFTIMED